MSAESRHNAAKKAWETRRANGWTPPRGKRAENRERARQGYGAPWSDSRPNGSESRYNAEPPRSAEPPRATEPGSSGNRRPFDTGVQGRGSIFDAYRILGVDSGAGAEAIQRAFKKLMIQNHPDRGSNDADRQIRTAKCAGISWAFHKLCPPN